MQPMHEHEGSHSALQHFTSDQVQRLLSLIRTPKAGLDKLSGKKSWLFDSGASYHMTGDTELLNNVSNIGPIPVGLANGSIIY